MPRTACSTPHSTSVACSAPAVAGGLAGAGRWDAAFLLAAMAMGVAVLLLSGLILTSLAPTRTSTITSHPRVSAPRDKPTPRWLAILVIAQVTMLWTLAYGQADGMMLLWARDYTQRVVLGSSLP